ncbi:MAG: hypothetical protein COV46_02520 [Deltaproteobacteria bacterium CG11_big_fil_rev_8_21_14_0_20_49_13]|nr:MAG: hypothetical protein COV46_02520 [Deltaproteobacteria bacterium CG11_big_fil_rev_8_21_14_0_20_49_13]
MGMGHPVTGIVSLVMAAAFLVWVYEKNGNPVQKVGKLIGWFGVIMAALLLIGQMFVCGKMCQSGQCMRMMKGQGMMQMPIMPPPVHGMPAPDNK